jgi:hypothetical protein
MKLLTKITINEGLKELTQDQKKNLANHLEKLQSNGHPDRIRNSLIEIRRDFGIDLLPWNSQLTLQPKISEVLGTLDISPRAMIVSCGKDSKPLAPRIKDLKIQSEDAAAAAKARRLEEKEQKRLAEETKCKIKIEFERQKYLEALGSVERIVGTIFRSEEIYKISFDFHLMCIDQNYNINNITTIEVINKHPEICNHIYSLVYKYLFYVDDTPNIQNLLNLFGTNACKIQELNASLLIKELPDFLTKIIINNTLKILG